MRKIHRWLLLTFGILLAWWTVTGVCLATIDLFDAQQAWAGDGGGPGAAAPTTVGGIEVARAGALSWADVDGATDLALRAAREHDAEARIGALEVTAENRTVRATVRYEQPAKGAVTVDVASGAVTTSQGDERPAGNGPSGSLHGTVKNIHRGSIPGLEATAGPLGSWLGIVTGSVLVLLAATGAWLYLQLWSARRKAGKQEFFWRDASPWRRWHRWVSACMAAFLLNQAITGALLSWFNIADASRAPPAAGAVAGYTSDDVRARVPEVWQRIQRAAPGAPVMALILTHNGSQPFAPVFIGGEHPGAIGFRIAENDYILGASGATGAGGASADSHSWMKRIHRGDFIGAFAGRWIALLAGVAMAWLLVSGLVMYIRSRRPRPAAAA